MTGHGNPELGIIPWNAVPPGQRTNPSRWQARIPVAVLALIGCGISTYLALFQYHVLADVWDPFFRDGSRKVLTSVISRSLPISDAALGAVAYFVECVLELSGGTRRWHDRPWLVVLLGISATGFSLISVALIISQPTLTGTFCTLCLCSAGISFVVATLVRHEIAATLQFVQRRRRAGRSLLDSVGLVSAKQGG